MREIVRREVLHSSALLKGQVPTKPGSDQAGDGCYALRGLKPWEQAGTDSTPL